MDVKSHDAIIEQVGKIQTYAELMVNASPEPLDLDGKIMIRIGAEIIESLNEIVAAVNSPQTIEFL